MRTPQNTGRLPRVRSWVITYPANPVFAAHTGQVVNFSNLSGLREGDELTLTPLLTPTGAPYIGMAASNQICWTVTANGDNNAFVQCLNVTAANCDRPEFRFRITARRP